MRKNSINKSTKNGVVYRNIFISHATAIYFREAETRSCPHHFEIPISVRDQFAFHTSSSSLLDLRNLVRSAESRNCRYLYRNMEFEHWYELYIHRKDRETRRKKTRNKIKKKSFHERDDKLVFSRYAHGGARKDAE